MGGRHTRPVPPLELTVRGRGVCVGGGGPWVSGKRCSARDPRGCAPQSRLGAGRCRWLRFFPVLPLPRFHAPSPLGWLCPAEIWGTRSPCADDPLRGRSPPTRSGCSDKGCAPAAAAKRVDSVSAFPTSLQFGKQIDILNKRKQKFSSQTTLPLWGGAKSAPRIASRATDAGRGLGPETRASRGGRRHGSAQALAARPCSLPSAGEGLAVPQSAGRARAQLARRFAQDYCIAAAPGVQACVCACVCVRLCVCTQPRPSLPGAAVPAPPPVPPPPLPLAAARAPARPRGSNCEFAR